MEKTPAISHLLFRSAPHNAGTRPSSAGGGTDIGIEKKDTRLRGRTFPASGGLCEPFSPNERIPILPTTMHPSIRNTSGEEEAQPGRRGRHPPAATEGAGFESPVKWDTIILRNRRTVFSAARRGSPARLAMTPKKKPPPSGTKTVRRAPRKAARKRDATPGMPDGTLFGAVTAPTDISERRETERQLKQIRDELERCVQERTRELRIANAYNRSLIEASIDPLLTITPDGKIGDANPAAEEITGYPRSDLLGRDFSGMFTDSAKARTGYRLVFDEGRVCDYELEIRRRDGRVTPVLYNASVFTDEDGAVNGAIAAVRDITRRRQVEAQSRRNTRRVEVMADISHLLVEAGPEFRPALPGIVEAVAGVLESECCLYLSTGDGRIHPAASFRIATGGAGRSSRDIPGIPEAVLRQVLQNRRPLFLPAGLAEAAADAGDAARALSPQTPLPSSLLAVPLSLQENLLGVLTATRYATGGPFTAEDLALLQNVADRLALAVTNANLFADLKNVLAEEQKTRQQLVQSEKLAAMGRILGSVAHELNNPLQTIKNCLYLVKQDAPEAASIQNYLEMAASETNRLVHLVAQLRELYRPHSERSMQPHDLRDILREVRTLLAQQLENAKVEWRDMDGPRRCIVLCDKERIQQVFINLATNAAEAMQPDGGPLSVGLVFSEDPLRVGAEFRDAGPGVSPELVHNLFDPFVTTKPSGLGLGLSICYEIAQKHGGTISVENPPGGGAVFTLWLPRIKKT
jgi:PAS domain S-box-containing protein